ncbi:MAG TPA: glycerol-3-phosphate 1-O-acyltransferase PlsY [Aquificales bacterium]|nr:glycerol-3-phosphate 1-O-acyltransferase PlsY [Aquificales bacterium]
MEVLLILISFFLGSIPFGYLLGLLKGVDIRRHGSGNVGATNVARVLGKKYGVIVYILDFLKGFIPTFLAAKLFGIDSWITALVGLAAVLGHMFSPFLGFRGGKGVATASGVLFGISPLLGFIVLAVWFLTFKRSGYVSLGSIVAALFSIFLVGVLNYPFPIKFLVTITAVLILVKHKSNLERLMEGRELKV